MHGRLDHATRRALARIHPHSLAHNPPCSGINWNAPNISICAKQSQRRRFSGGCSRVLYRRQKVARGSRLDIASSRPLTAHACLCVARCVLSLSATLSSCITSARRDADDVHSPFSPLCLYQRTVSAYTFRVCMIRYSGTVWATNGGGRAPRLSQYLSPKLCAFPAGHSAALISSRLSIFLFH